MRTDSLENSTSEPDQDSDYQSESSSNDADVNSTLNQVNIYELELVKAAMTLNDPEIQSHLSHLKDDVFDLLPVIDIIVTKLLQNFLTTD